MLHRSPVRVSAAIPPKWINSFPILKLKEPESSLSNIDHTSLVRHGDERLLAEALEPTNRQVDLLPRMYMSVEIHDGGAVACATNWENECVSASACCATTRQWVRSLAKNSSGLVRDVTSWTKLRCHQLCDFAQMAYFPTCVINAKLLPRNESAYCRGVQGALGRLRCTDAAPLVVVAMIVLIEALARQQMHNNVVL
ncbi:hypothetical protein LSAT2_010958 [Lamellibrachia satsuma]|nr:hypothetical protein LSAT2_010958 [Lamellibrachia satsuma]